VVIAIIGVLIALLLPAVQAAREAARRMQCTNKLKQLAIAVHNYVDVHTVLPAGLGGPYGHLNNDEYGRWSGFIALLPYIEQNPLYDRFLSENVYFNAGVSDPHVVSAAHGGKNNPQATQLDLLICPSNGVTGKPDDHTGYTCYRFNYGDNPAPWSVTLNSYIRGPFGTYSYYPLSAIRDGLSNTLCFSEKAVDSYNAKSKNMKVQAAVYTVTATGGFSGGHLSDRSVCIGSVSNNEYQFGVGGITDGFSRKFSWQWCGYSWVHVGLVTTLPPNSPSCYIAGTNYNAMFSATSFHIGGVNVTLLDGSGTFISETVDSGTANAFPTPSAPSGKSPFGIWGAYGSRDGGEATSL
jgi:hypothetical protein